MSGNQLNYAYNLLGDPNGTTISGLSGKVTTITSPLDLRFGNGAQQRIARVNSVCVWMEQSSDVSTLVKLYMLQGITDSTAQRGLPSRYTYFNDEGALLLDKSDVGDPLTSGYLHVIPMPMVLTPFVKFQLDVLNTSVSALYWIWAVCSEKLS